MSGDLALAVVVFLASAAAVWVLGAGLSKYGDVLADLTGLGRLFVGSILVALATSLPELSTNISAVRLDPPNPDLAVGNVLGANMLDLFIFAMVALLFGGRRFLQQVAPEQGYLIVLAAAMTGLAVVMGSVEAGHRLLEGGNFLSAAAGRVRGRDVGGVPETAHRRAGVRGVPGRLAMEKPALAVTPQ